MAIDPDEDLLDEIFAALTITDRAIDEIEQARLIALYDFLECALFAAEKRGDELRIFERLQLGADRPRYHSPRFHRHVCHLGCPPNTN